MNVGIILLCMILFLPGFVIGEISDQNASITLERGSCYEICPEYSLTLSGNGTVIYDGKKGVREIGIRYGTINISAFNRLLDQFEKAGFFRMKSEYTECYTAYCFFTDQPYVTLTIREGNRITQVKHYTGNKDAPKILTDLEDAVDKSANVNQCTVLDPSNPDWDDFIRQ